MVNIDVNSLKNLQEDLEKFTNEGGMDDLYKVHESLAYWANWLNKHNTKK